MKNNTTNTQGATLSKSQVRTGWVISIICILFLLFDGITKIIKESHSVSGTVMLGFTENFVPILGLISLPCTLLYAIRRTSVIGALLLTSYLGGAVAIMTRAGVSPYFPIIFGILIWVGLFLRDRRTRALLAGSVK